LQVRVGANYRTENGCVEFGGDGVRSIGGVGEIGFMTIRTIRRRKVGGGRKRMIGIIIITRKGSGVPEAYVQFT